MMPADAVLLCGFVGCRKKSALYFRNLPAGGRGGGGVTGRFAKSTSSTTKSAHMQRHKVAEQAAANSENQASGMRRLFHGRGAVTEADEVGMGLCREQLSVFLR
jgi:hypothetical protein